MSLLARLYHLSPSHAIIEMQQANSHKPESSNNIGGFSKPFPTQQSNSEPSCRGAGFGYPLRNTDMHVFGAAQGKCNNVIKQIATFTQQTRCADVPRASLARI